MRAIRWGDNDRYWGPFTSCLGDNYRTLEICIRSGDDEDRLPSFRISIGRWSFLSVLPSWVIKPESKKVYPQWDAATIARLGRDWYEDITPREYGIHILDGHLSIHYGRVTMDSSTEQYWGCFLPWTQWRHVRRSLYGLQGEHFWSELEWEADLYRRAARMGRPELGRERYDIIRQWEELCPSQRFLFKDFDDELISASTRIEEREWRFGTGYFKWLSVFRRPKVSRSLDIRFSGETGHRKGSWKGGTVGHSIEMLPGELHRAAFERYCQQHEMTLLD
jgi:hypothetical protein